MTLIEITERYGGLMWHLANRYAVGSLEREDVYSELLVRLYERLQKGLPQKHIKACLITGAIDLNRKERRFRRRDDVPLDESPATRQAFEPAVDDRLVRSLHECRDLVFSLMPKEDAELVWELVFPGERTVEIAEAQRSKALRARETGQLRMNVKTLRVTQAHVAEALGVPPDRVMRAKRQASDLLWKALDSEGRHRMAVFKHRVSMRTE